MKRMLLGFSLSFLIAWTPATAAEPAAATVQTGVTATVYECPMQGCGASLKDEPCPLCGMKMEEKTMTAAEAQAAIDRTKDLIRKRR